MVCGNAERTTPSFLMGGAPKWAPILPQEMKEPPHHDDDFGDDDFGDDDGDGDNDGGDAAAAGAAPPGPPL